MKGKIKRVSIATGSIAALSLSLAFTPLALAPTVQAQTVSSRVGAATPSSFGEKINDLVQSDYPGSYSGVVINKDSVTIYMSSGNGSLLKALANMPGSSKVKYKVVVVPHSFKWMEKLISRIAQESSVIRSQGVITTSLIPDPATGEVDVYLSSPTSFDRSALASTLQMRPDTVTTSNYRQKATTLLRQRFGSAIDVEPSYRAVATFADAPETPPSPLSRRNDISPFSGGDDIVTSAGFGCTGGFSVKRNATGDTFMLTAGHCGGGTWYVGGIITNPMGAVAHKFYEDGINDFEMISTTAIGFVWGGSESDPVKYTVTGPAFLPPDGAGIAWDGAVTREVRNVAVVATGAEEELEDETTGEDVTVQNLIVSNNLDPLVAQGGDSGGPIFEHTCQTCNTIKPIGTIVGQLTDPEDGIYLAYAEYLGTELDYGNSSVIDG